ncbi:MAG: acetylglutamate kinase [Halobacteriota archaeon]
MKREQILIEALPYIREFYGSFIVIKIGGHAMVDKRLMEGIIEDIVLLRYVGMQPVLVHGGGPEISEKMELMGKKPEFVSGLRITDEETLEIARMVLVGNINTRLVALIGKHGGKGVGLSGKDGRMITARKKAPQRVIYEGIEREVDLGWVGETEVINPEIIMIMAGKGYIPVIAPIAVDSTCHSLNLNADTVAGDVAASLMARKLISMTDVNGIQRDLNDPHTVVECLTVADVEHEIERGGIHGGMIPKVRACVQALNAGVQQAHIINGNVHHALLLELFTREGIGTMIVKRKTRKWRSR